MHQDTIKAGDCVEVIVAGGNPVDWSYDGAEGRVVKVHYTGRQHTATVHISTKGRQGPRVMPLCCLKKL